MYDISPNLGLDLDWIMGLDWIGLDWISDVDTPHVYSSAHIYVVCATQRLSEIMSTSTPKISRRLLHIPSMDHSVKRPGLPNQMVFDIESTGEQVGVLVGGDAGVYV